MLTSVPALDSSKHFLSHTHTYTHTCPRACVRAREAMKPYPCLKHLNWAPAPPDPTEFKVSREKGPPFPREGPEEGGGVAAVSWLHTTKRLLAAQREQPGEREVRGHAGQLS